MLTLCKSTVLAAAFLTGTAIAPNADPASTSVAGTQPRFRFVLGGQDAAFMAARTAQRTGFLRKLSPA
jgi:hypothetical protein